MVGTRAISNWHGQSWILALTVAEYERLEQRECDRVVRRHRQSELAYCKAAQRTTDRSVRELRQWRLSNAHRLALLKANPTCVARSCSMAETRATGPRMEHRWGYRHGINRVVQL